MGVKVIKASKHPLPVPVTHLVQGDANTQVIRFMVKRADGGVDLSGLVWSVWVRNNAGKAEVSYIGRAEVDGEWLVMDWKVIESACSDPGRTVFRLYGERDGEWKTAWVSADMIIEVLPVLGIDPGYDEEEIEAVRQLIIDFNEACDTIRSDVNDEVKELSDAQNTLKNRMDVFTTLPDVTTTGEAEIADIRVGANGKVYTNAGIAVREQVKNLTNRLDGEFEILGQRMVYCPFTEALLNYDSDLYVEAGKTYTLSKDADNEHFVYAYVLGDDSNVCLMHNGGVPYTFTPQISGYVRFYDRNGLHDTITVSVSVENNYGSRITDCEGKIEVIRTDLGEQIEMIGQRQVTAVFDEYGNFNSDIKVEAGKTYYFSKDLPAEIKVYCYVPPYAAGILQVLIDKPGVEYAYTPDRSGIMRFFSGDHKNKTAQIYCRTEDGFAHRIVSRVEALEGKEEEVYECGDGTGVTFIGLLKSLAGNTKPKTIMVRGGSYDLYAEYIAESVTIPPSGHNTSDYFGYNVFVPPNTKIIGMGQVEFRFEPTLEQLTALGGDAARAKTIADIWCPINAGGAIEMENITIRARNCRYCIHDDMHSEDIGSKHVYRNVHCVMGKSDLTAAGAPYGFSHTVGMGWAPRSTHIYDNCVFENNSRYNGKCSFYGHGYSDAQANDLGLSAADGAVIELINCVFVNEKQINDAIRFQTLAKDKPEHVSVRMSGCYTNSGVYFNSYNAGAHNTFDLTVMNTKFDIGSADKFTADDTDNPYPPKVYG